MFSCLLTTSSRRFDAIEPLSLKGKSKRVRAYMPKINQDAPAQKLAIRISGGTQSKYDLSGRDHEMRILCDMMDQLVAKRGGTLLLTGDRGSGKNSLSKGIVSMGDKLDLHVFDVVSKVESGRFTSMSRGTTILHPLQTGWGGWPLILQQIIQAASAKAGVTDTEWVTAALKGDASCGEEDLSHLYDALMLTFVHVRHHDCPGRAFVRSLARI